MNNATTLYLRLLLRIVRESAWRLGGGEESFLAVGLSGSDTSAPQRPTGHDRERTRPVVSGGRQTPPVVCGGPVERDNRAGS